MRRERVAEVRTYSLIEELLTAKGWDLRRPPQGDLLAQQEYKDVPALKEALKACAKSGNAFRLAGFTPLIVAVAGTESDRFDIRIGKWDGARWRDITYENTPISWIPGPEQLSSILTSAKLFELRPEIPPPEVLKAKAEEINTLLRESGLKDDFRPAAIGAIMLALWKSKGDIRRDAKYVLADINQACQQAYWEAQKPDLPALGLRQPP